jgi:hypothetical protein
LNHIRPRLHPGNLAHPADSGIREILSGKVACVYERNAKAFKETVIPGQDLEEDRRELDALENEL